MEQLQQQGTFGIFEQLLTLLSHQAANFLPGVVLYSCRDIQGLGKYWGLRKVCSVYQSAAAGEGAHLYCWHVLLPIKTLRQTAAVCLCVFCITFHFSGGIGSIYHGHQVSLVKLCLLMETIFHPASGHFLAVELLVALDQPNSSSCALRDFPLNSQWGPALHQHQQLTNILLGV